MAEDSEESCCPECRPTEDPMGFCSLVSFLCVCLGILLIAVGYLTPRTYVFDPTMEARKMEAIEIYYADLNWKLDILTMVGLFCVTLGGFMMASIVVYVIYITCRENMDDRPSTQDKTTNRRSYGTLNSSNGK